MHTLLIKDGLGILYGLVQFVVLLFWFLPAHGLNSIGSFCVVGLLILHFAALVYRPPAHLPDFHPLLAAVTSCGLFCAAWLIGMTQFFATSTQKRKPE
jgi:hypothetical protein